MKLKTYKNVDGGTSMISVDNAFAEIKELGHNFAVALAERGHETKESDLMNGLAAYHTLNLKGENARCDAAHSLVMSVITEEMFNRVRAA
jgi:hypothetical protein